MRPQNLQPRRSRVSWGPAAGASVGGGLVVKPGAVLGGPGVFLRRPLLSRADLLPLPFTGVSPGQVVRPRPHRDCAVLGLNCTWRSGRHPLVACGDSDVGKWECEGGDGDPSCPGGSGRQNAGRSPAAEEETRTCCAGQWPGGWGWDPRPTDLPDSLGLKLSHTLGTKGTRRGGGS